MIKGVVLVYITFSFCGLTLQTVDLNLRQLQFVSDHLTRKECGKLITTLKNNIRNTMVDEAKILPSRSGEEHCLLDLVAWNEGPGKNMTVEELTLHLHQIGRDDIGRRLAEVVHDESVRELHKYFLDNPFHKTARQKSMLLTDSKKEDGTEMRLVKPDQILVNVSYAHQQLFVTAVIAMTFILTLCVLLTSMLYCPKAYTTFCPQWCVNCFLTIQDSIKDTLADCRILAETHFFRMGKRPFTVPTEDQVQLQKNLVNDVLNV